MSSFSGGDEQGAGAELSAQELALESVSMVRAIVDEIVARVPKSVRRDDLQSAGLVALTDAARAFDPERDGGFEVYATALIRSALLDVVIASQSQEIAARVPDEPTSPAADRADVDERLVGLRTAIGELSERHRRVVGRYFLDNEPVAGIADELGVAEAQVVRLRTEALMLLRDALAATSDPKAEPWERDAARRAMYAALASRRSLVQASSMPDTWDLRLEA